MSVNVSFSVKAIRNALYTLMLGQRFICKTILTAEMDDNPALFVTLRSPHERIKIGGIESRLREIGEDSSDIHKVHPHKFRRTLATTGN